ncbi:hypothetical protein ACLBOM_03340 [Escherichia coli]
MQELEARLKEAREAGARHVLIATDGVLLNGRRDCQPERRFAIWQINTMPW